ncbi:MAG: hypothetical protein ACLQVD_19495 [Capsulimonadaceae bacterium]
MFNQEYHNWLVPYAEGELDPRRRSLLEARLAIDAALADELARIKRIVGHLKTTVNVPAGEGVRRSVWPRVEARISEQRPAPVLWRRPAFAVGLASAAAAGLIVVSLASPHHPVIQIAAGKSTSTNAGPNVGPAMTPPVLAMSPLPMRSTHGFYVATPIKQTLRLAADNSVPDAVVADVNGVEPATELAETLRAGIRAPSAPPSPPIGVAAIVRPITLMPESSRVNPVRPAAPSDSGDGSMPFIQWSSSHVAPVLAGSTIAPLQSNDLDNLRNAAQTAIAAGEATALEKWRDALEFSATQPVQDAETSRQIDDTLVMVRNAGELPGLLQKMDHETQVNPDTVAWRILAHIYLVSGNSVDAVRAWSHVAESADASIEDWYQLGQAEEANDRSDEAVEAYRHIVNDAELHNTQPDRATDAEASLARLGQ